MKDVVRPWGWMLLGVLVALHIILGAYAVHDGGSFGFGFNAPERLVYYKLAGSDFHFTVTGSMKGLVNDLCLKTCESCPMDCYESENVMVSCAGGCELRTAGGRTLAKEGDSFATLSNGGMFYQDATFRCWDGECGFDMRIGKNMTYSTRLPDSIKAST